VKPSHLWMAALVLVGSCRFAPLRNRDDPTQGLAFGRIAITGTQLEMTHVVLRRIDAVSIGGPEGIRRTHTSVDGYFYSHNLDPGRYAVLGFYTTAGNFRLKSALSCCAFEVRSGDVSFAGTYQVAYVHQGLFDLEDNTFTRDDSSASELDVLDWLATKVVGATDWAPLARARIAKLRSSAQAD
jgi:hypothetical protein